MKKLFVALGTTATIVAPIASSVSFAATPAQKAWQDFKNAVNDASKDQEALVNWTPELKLKLSNSTFYKNHTSTGTNTWNIADTSELHAVLVSLQKSSEFTAIEKEIIGKRIVQNQMCADIFKNFGFYGETTTNAIISARGLLADPSKTGVNFTLGGHIVNLVGTTGENTDFRDQHKEKHQHEYNFSNQDILNYYLAVVVKSPEFNALINDFTTTQTIFMTGKSSFKDAITGFYSHVNDFLNKIATPKLSAGTILNTSVFSRFTPVDVSFAKDDDEAYGIFMNSPLAQILYPNGDAKTRLDAYNAQTVPTLKKINQITELSLLQTQLEALKQITSPFLKTNGEIPSTIANNSDDENDPLKDPEALAAATEFAKTLADYSDGFTNDVQLLVANDPINGYLIMIKSGHNYGAWNDLNDSQIKIPYYVVTDSDFDEQYGFKNYLKTGKDLVDVVKNVSNKNQTINLSTSSGSTLYVETGAVVGTGYARGFYLHPQFDFNGVTKVLNPQWAYENDHDNDSAVKESNWTASIQGATWDSANTRAYASNAKMTFYYDSGAHSSIGDHNAVKNFNDLSVALNNAFSQITNKVQDIIAGKIDDGFAYDPLASYTFKITLNNIVFGQTYFNTYDDSGWDDTHVDHVRFANVSANFSYQIIETKSN